MKPRNLVFYLSLFLSFYFIFGCKKEDSTHLPMSSEEDNLPITIQAIREGEKLLIQVQPQPGFGIQIDAPNQIQLQPQSGLELSKTTLEWKGIPRKDKPEYYETIQPFSTEVKGKGDLALVGKVYYCNFSKNICIPGKIYRLWKGI